MEAQQATPPWAQQQPPLQQQQPEQVQATPGNTITVGCKLPNGLHMDIMRHGEPLQRVTLRGSNTSNVIGGYGITENVNAEFFAEWQKRNASHPAVRNGLIFAHEQTRSVKNEAKSRAGVLNGLERLDPKKPGKGLSPVPGPNEKELADESDD